MSAEAAIDSFRYITNYRRLNQLEHGLLTSIDYDGSYGRTRNVCFIGSGPLPISSWLLVERLRAMWCVTGVLRICYSHLDICPSSSHPWTITNVDLDAASHKQGHDFFVSLLGSPDHTSASSNLANNTLPSLTDGTRGRVDFLTTSATSLTPDFLAQQDLVYCAAMVGSDDTVPSKEDIIRYLVSHLKPGARLLSRSGEGVKKLIYATIREEWAVENDACFECVVRLGYHLTSPVIIRKN